MTLPQEGDGLGLWITRVFEGFWFLTTLVGVGGTGIGVGVKAGSEITGVSSDEKFVFSLAAKEVEVTKKRGREKIKKLFFIYFINLNPWGRFRSYWCNYQARESNRQNEASCRG